MKNLLIQIALRLEDYQLDEFKRPHGTLFHRWLPDGCSNAITLDTGNEYSELKVWFERKGFIRDGWIEFDYKREEVDPDIMIKQAKLDAGPLFGYLRITDVTESEYAAVTNNKVGSPEYMNFGKRVIELIHPPISQLLRVLRITFGQYWIRELEQWDSRDMSLGNYCRSRLHLSWSIDEGDTWNDFAPNEQIVNLHSHINLDEDFSVFLSEENYRDLPKILAAKNEPSLGAETLSYSHRIFDDGDIRHAFIEATIALEMIIHEFIHRKLSASATLTKYDQSFFDLPLRAQLISLSLMIEKINTEDLELASEAINIRNKIVHEGWQPVDDRRTRKIFMTFIRVCSYLLDGPKLRFPSMHLGNQRENHKQINLGGS